VQCSSTEENGIKTCRLSKRARVEDQALREKEKSREPGKEWVSPLILESAAMSGLTRGTGKRGRS